jgi:hypothetical protein
VGGKGFFVKIVITSSRFEGKNIKAKSGVGHYSRMVALVMFLHL